MKRNKLLERDEFDRFLGALQLLEVACGLMLSSQHEKSRMAIILLHSLAERLMFSEVIEKFDSDVSLSRVSVPNYTAQFRKKVLRYFDEKVDFCRNTAELISDADATIFKILNFYRNAAYHRDSHNPNVISSIARISFHATLRLFERTAGNSSVSIWGLSEEQSSSLTPFCQVENFIDYEKAAKEAAQKLGEKVAAFPSDIRSSFVADIKGRLAKLERMKTETLYCKTASDLDEIFKKSAFELKGIEDDLSLELKQLNYRITGQVSGAVPSWDEYQAAEQKYIEKMKAAYDSFIPEVTAATLDLISDKVQLLEGSATLEAALSLYLQLDQSLVEVEVLAFHAERRIDLAVQLQLDIERGK
ncbi:hypothetical protein ACTRXD_06590 [Nitrospira sp. T9]